MALHCLVNIHSCYSLSTDQIVLRIWLRQLNFSYEYLFSYVVDMYQNKDQGSDTLGKLIIFTLIANVYFKMVHIAVAVGCLPADGAVFNREVAWSIMTPSAGRLQLLGMKFKSLLPPSAKLHSNLPLEMDLLPSSKLLNKGSSQISSFQKFDCSCPLDLLNRAFLKWIWWTF